MIFNVNTVALEGLKVLSVQVQVSLVAGMPSFNIVGLADKAVAESKERVRSSLSAMGLSLPSKRITINLAPADITKVGSHYDLPIAVGILGAMGILEQEDVDKFVCLGELSLNANLAQVGGVLPSAVYAYGQKLGIICPKKNGHEAAWAGDLDIIAPDNLQSLVNHLKGKQLVARPSGKVSISSSSTSKSLGIDMQDIKGQKIAKRALEIAAAGGHNILFSGPPGAGKSMLADRISTILPPLLPEEILDVSMINSVAGSIIDGDLHNTRPFRAPHHSSSMVAIVGGGRKAYPGEVSLAHNGVLFLDEFPEFSKDVMESLRQPIESGEVTIARANKHITYPANFQLIAAMNPCRCGYATDAQRACSKLPKCAEEYKNKISGPIYDRFDIYIEVGEMSAADMISTSKDVNNKGDNSATIAKRVAAARQLQFKRNAKVKGVFNKSYLNSNLAGEQLEQLTGLQDNEKQMLKKAVEKFGISMRGLNRILKVARTIADLANSKNIEQTHLQEAISYRVTN